MARQLHFVGNRQMSTSGQYRLRRPLSATILFLAVTVEYAMPLPVAPQEPEPFRISVNADLVVLHASVRDRSGGFASGLNKASFEIFEEGVRQEIRLFHHEDVPVTVGLIVDHSGSMDKKLPDVIEAARTFVKFSSPLDEMFVVNFNENLTLGLPGAFHFSARADELAAAISRTRAEGMTALYDAVAAGLNRLESGTRDKKILVVVSDGGDNASRLKIGELSKLAVRSGAIIYAIGIFADSDPDRNPDVLKRLAQETGGEAIFPGDLSTVTAACERIARDIRNQYTLGYAPATQQRAGQWRTLRVTARSASRKLAVRTRSGYFTGRPQ